MPPAGRSSYLQRCTRRFGRSAGLLVRAIVDDTIPTALSLFGLINFESVLFLLGSAVFLLALVKEREEMVSRIAASTDPLTGIDNRGGFMLRGDRVVDRCRRDGSPVSVLMFDLDRFKKINDTFGHAVGDAALLKFCEVASGALRPNDVFGRIGGEEFAVVLPGSGIEAAWVRAERIRTSFMERCRKLGRIRGPRHRQRRRRHERGTPPEPRHAARVGRRCALQRKDRRAKPYQAFQ